MTYIILPYKDRNGKYESALELFMQPFIEYLTKNLIEFQLIIIEQSGGSLKNSLPSLYKGLLDSLGIDENEEFFNLGRTINVGFDIIKNQIKQDDVFMFHPVDLLPISVNYNVDITTKFCFREHSPDGRFYKSIGFKASDFVQINGFSNEYWGWGLEDDDLFIRLSKNNIQIDTSIDDYKRLTIDGNGHSDSDHYMPLYDYNSKFLHQMRLRQDCSISGLNNLSYKLLSIEKYKNINKFIIE